MFGAAAVCGLPGCSQKPFRSTPLRFWNGFTGPDGRNILSLVRKFNESHTGPDVLMQRMDWGTYYSKLFVAGLGGRAPDIFVIHADAMVRFQAAGFLKPIDDVLANGNLPADDLDKDVMAEVRIKGETFGLPLDVHPIGMFYNRNMLSEIGADTVPEDPEGFMEAMLHIRDKAGSKRWAFVFNWLRTAAYSIIRQYGGDLVDIKSHQPTFASDANLKAMGWCTRLIDEGIAPSPANFDSWIGFRQGRVGVAWEGSYMLEDAKRQSNLNFGIQPIPRVGHQHAAWANAHVVCLRNDLEGDRLAQAVRFIRYLSDESASRAVSGMLPVRASIRQHESIKQNSQLQGFIRSIPSIALFPSVPYTFEMLSEFDVALERILRSGKDPAEAMGLADHNLASIVERYLQNGWT